ncbi:hypothetical protein ACFOEE_18745 [Pseudoalteromonas fenneropenaei]|uniref:Secreted protein n=1 Tax=Pseudoalteromonas fenneropenaei TaxID=1737459 RepID=A0ABV7CPE5_9GAMM
MRIWLLTLPFILSLSACSNEEPQTASLPTPSAQSTETTEVEPVPSVKKQHTSAEEEIVVLKARLAQLTQDKPCQQSAECRVLPVGHRACGGPDGFVVFSTQNNDANQLEALANTITSLQRQLNFAEQRMSICQHLTAPAAQCIEHQCTAVEIQQEAM